METKLIYWVPIIGVFFSLKDYDKENGLSAFWNYYQAFMIIAFIMIMTFVTVQE